MKKFIKRIFDGEIRGIDEKEQTLTAFVSTSARDRMDEVVSAEGGDLKKFKKNPVVLFAHDYNQPPIAKALWIKREGDGILSKMKFASTEFAQEIFNLYKDGFMKAFSIGFVPKEYKFGKGKEDPSVTYLKWELLEYSAVPVPANPEALALAISKGVLKNDTLKELLEIEEEEPKDDDEEITPEEPEEKAKYKCECIKCGHKVTTEKHCKDIKCSKCGGTMRRADRPGPGQADVTSSTELLAEIDQLKKESVEIIETLKEEIFNLKGTILDLRYRLLQADKPVQEKEKTLSEMTESEILSKIEEITLGVIRKVTGKVN